MGYPVIGHLVAHRGGHELHAAFAEKLLEESDAWRVVEVSSLEVKSVATPVTTKVPVPLAN